MGKRIFIILMTVVVSSLAASAQRLLPVSVQQFMQERDERHRLAAYGVDATDAFRFVPSRDVDGREVVDAFVVIDNESVLPLLKEMGVIVITLLRDFAKTISTS